MKKYLGLALLLFVTGCGTWYEVDEEADVLAVYWHEGNDYSVAIQDGDRVRIRRIPIAGRRHHINGHWEMRIYTDAETPWYKCKGRFNDFHGGGQEGSYCEIHLRSIDDITGAGWNHGKYGSGQTTRID